MVLPIIVGVGATIVAFAVKTTASAYRKFNLLTPEMIGLLNNIKVQRPTTFDVSHPHASQHDYIRRRFINEGFGAKMTENEALMVLGIEGDEIIHLNKQIIKDRYRKLMIANHPDRNGSVYLSQKINEAKAILDESPLSRK
ncbi:Mitochondrial import motor associating protein [Yamadazyma tenuis]|uniref:J domain-containing protein n=1 Tax=Candida tenuis (strain ATCC 10573 / BCRC 21748 / CBS 615 / JCM 9827 / NBRC 10315 / NRRL Y-1498 / VKM Y-70) TaxID=590646 RepID=G3AWQ8_CANTC|nr:uncharacterized protein CANTEDRAFT_91766 [Yamadazyma tenuis ATCC 10573]EGV66591.1 hypothetical protein CANTEDRAFT_91766 [Yamadazyma tenuis ATCC 10573]WEJ95281.1 Mitochondrial import motor associating protein [Yamadazyma tenuis]